VHFCWADLRCFAAMRFLAKSSVFITKSIQEAKINDANN